MTIRIFTTRVTIDKVYFNALSEFEIDASSIDGPRREGRVLGERHARKVRV